MSEESKPENKTFEFPMMPPFGFDMARELGSIDSRLIRVENDIAKLDAKIDAVEAKLEAKIDAVEAKLEAKIDAVEAKLEAKIDALDAKIDAIDAKFEAKTDKMSVALYRLDERTKSMQTQIMVIGGGILIAVIAGLVVQFFSK